MIPLPTRCRIDPDQALGQKRKKVPLHRHPDQDEIFYCLKGEGFGVQEDGEVELAAGKVFIVPAGAMHTVRSDGVIFVASFLVPVVEQGE